MSYDFNGTSQSLSLASAPVTAAPFTIACWFRPTTLTADRGIISIDSGANSIYYLYSSGTTLSYFVRQANGANQNITSGALNSNTWSHVCAVESSSSNRVLYNNGTAGTAGSTNLTPSVNEMRIAAARSNTNSIIQWSQGQIMDVAVWNAALTAAEVASLSKGFSPSLVQPGSLVFYAPLIRDLIDYAASATITNNNTATVANNTRVYGL